MSTKQPLKNPAIKTPMHGALIQDTIALEAKSKQPRMSLREALEQAQATGELSESGKLRLRQSSAD